MINTFSEVKKLFDCNLFLVAILLTIGKGNVQAQKIDYERVAINYTQLPYKALPEGFTTYQTFIAPIGETKILVKLTEGLTNSIILHGLKRETENYDLEIALLLDDMKITDLKHGFNSVASKDFDNKPTTKLQGTFSFQYTFPAILRLRSYNGITLLDTIISPKQPFTKSEIGNFTNEDEWNKFWDRKKKAFLAFYQEEQIKIYINEVNSILDSRYAYTNKIAEHKIAIPRNDRKTNFDYKSYQQAFDQVKSGFEKRQPTDILTGKDDILAAIQIWEDELKQAQPDNKDAKVDRKVSYATHLNCAVAYLWIFDFVKAQDHFEKADSYKSTFSGGDFKGLERTIRNQVKRHSQHPNWVGTIKPLTTREKPATYGSDSPLIKTKNNNSWLAANPPPDLDDPFNIDDPTIKILLAHPWKTQKIIRKSTNGIDQEVYTESGGYVKTVVYLGSPPISGMYLKADRKVGSVGNRANRSRLDWWEFKPNEKILELIFAGMRGGYFQILEISQSKIVMRESALEDGSYNVLYLISDTE
ncbi:MAG: hypothetical protein ACKVOQ_01930 [Cyclobacteriaceae bacterium]